MFWHTDIPDKIKETNPAQKGHYGSHQDCSYFKDNHLLSSLDELLWPLLLYTDDVEIANPLGTSSHKLSTVYWILADVPRKHRSALHVIQLATLPNISDLERFGYERALGSLLKDTFTLEQDGVFIKSIGKAVWGGVWQSCSPAISRLYFNSFRATYFCRFCTATIDQIRSHEVGGAEFSKASHDSDVYAVMHGENQEQGGVQGDCVLNQTFECFNAVTGDGARTIVMDLKEAVELSLWPTFTEEAI